LDPQSDFPFPEQTINVSFRLPAMGGCKPHATLADMILATQTK
jgi:hypothetical protein